MKKWLFRILWIPAFVLAVLFLVANRQLVAVSLDPFSASAPSLTTPALPMWLWLMTMLFIGLGAGSAGMWLSGRSRRQKAHAAQKELKALRAELTETNAKLRAAEMREEVAMDQIEASPASSAENTDS